MPQLMPAMPPPRIDLGELKSQLAKRLGPERARRYFSYLHQLLSLKLRKSEFNKLCFLTIGRENVPLHNQLIQSVIKNAYQAKTPPPLKKPLQREDGLKPPPHPLIWSNGEILPQSPRRRRSVTQRSKLGLNEKVDVSILENGDLGYHELKRRHDDQDGQQAEPPLKRHRLDSNGIDEVICGEDRDFIKQKNDLKLSHGPLQAPLGIPFCPASVGRAKRSLSAGGSTRFGSFWSFSDSGELCHTEDLRKRMERIAERHGLGGVTLDSANLLNHSLDVYLQRLIKSSMELVRARVGPETIKQPVPKQKAHDKPINGIWPDRSMHLHGNNPLDLQERKCCLITRQDFTVAMKLNPQQLGEDAALWLEKICFHSFEE
ncbi:hypothetical protein KFK09_006254 [Dendrobium nobile]|uniref:Transcriptional coactivator Hfi1/Transcriptional adapter 1 n=1 Tax=Dendrobium nobile TaxID=94219 RepID=A0A8T3BP51_DENNO|nr:hypothetical protein KFK09_006254 [Dendrobium nobile]